MSKEDKIVYDNKRTEEKAEAERIDANKKKQKWIFIVNWIKIKLIIICWFILRRQETLKYTREKFRKKAEDDAKSLSPRKSRSKK